ncbi:hypothetical protein NDU88_006409 [Pleurodeles waltl]|uniref:Uncharacterized protein n=1 Tax=Pleurodeles waltl TaxID=8319 RepID=A0AAV7RS00_PLEWA|nr:hypothetical protein NDU88_006409 [Pleurodeles waltl]
MCSRSESCEAGSAVVTTGSKGRAARRTQATGTQRECDPKLGRASVTKREQRWAEVRRAGCRWLTPGET